MTTLDTGPYLPSENGRARFQNSGSHTVKNACAADFFLNDHKINIRIVKSFTPEIGRCGLCSAEKLEILKSQTSSLLNSRDEIMSVCRHKKKYFLENYLK